MHTVLRMNVKIHQSRSNAHYLRGVISAIPTRIMPTVRVGSPLGRDSRWKASNRYGGSEVVRKNLLPSWQVAYWHALTRRCALTHNLAQARRKQHPASKYSTPGRLRGVLLGCLLQIRRLKSADWDMFVYIHSVGGLIVLNIGPHIGGDSQIRGLNVFTLFVAAFDVFSAEAGFISPPFGGVSQFVRFLFESRWCSPRCDHSP